MAPSRGQQRSNGRLTSTPILPSLNGFQHAAIASPDESTPRAPEARFTTGLSSPDIPDGEDLEDEEEDDDADFQSHYSNTRSSSGSSGSDAEDADDVDLLQSGNPFIGANAFAPPFYNRPPTPLPPSPSLTSLLRPSFSTATSRPTTPDSSENDTEAAVAKSARRATTVPRASPKVPTYEYYGFVLYLVSSLVFLMCLLWSYLPSPFLHQLGIYYYPNRWWSLAIPSFLVMTIVYIYVALASYNTGYLTLPMNSIENIVDDAANVAVLDSKGKIKRKARGTKDERKKDGRARENGNLIKGEIDWVAAWSEGTDAVMDVPIGGVCEILYGDEDSREEVAELYDGYPDQ